MPSLPKPRLPPLWIELPGVSVSTTSLAGSMTLASDSTNRDTRLTASPAVSHEPVLVNAQYT
jgi:hypothetical protein